MSMLVLQRDGNGCLQTSFRPLSRMPVSVAPVQPPIPVSFDDSASECPVYSNDYGLRDIRVTSRKFACIGQSPPHDHPRVFLEMGDQKEIACPYCSTRFRFPARSVRFSRPNRREG
jgi:uncharacterized Zn-finger protein